MTTKPLTRRVGLRLGAALTVVALVAVACGSDDATTSTTAASTTTSVPTTTAPTSTTSPNTTASSTSTTAPDTNSFAEGSGCSPGTTGSLPDGEWFGYVAAATTGELEFDLACWFAGDAAADAAAEDGAESPPPNDYYVRNLNDMLRTLDVAGNAGVRWLPNAGDPSTAELVTYPDWLTGRAERDYQPGVWLVIEDGAITDIQEQYVP